MLSRSSHLITQLRRVLAKTISDFQSAQSPTASNEKKIILTLECLRNLAPLPEIERIVEDESHFGDLLVHIMEYYVESEDIMLLCARIISLLTQNETFCLTLQVKEPNWVLYLAQSIERHIQNPLIVVRLMFVAGNAVANVEKCRCGFQNLKRFWKSLTEGRK